MVDILKQVGTTDWEMETLNMFVNFSNCDLMVTYSSVTFPFLSFLLQTCIPITGASFYLDDFNTLVISSVYLTQDYSWTPQINPHHTTY